MKPATFIEGHLTTFAVTLVSGALSALALGHHVQMELEWTGHAKTAAVALASAFAFLTAMCPISLARAHGESQEGGNPQSALLCIVLGLMIVDGGLQVHAVQYLVKSMDMPALNLWACIGLAAVFQMALFFVRGALYASTKETQDLIDAREHHLKEVAAHAKARDLAKRRERYHERNNVVNMR